MSEELKNLLDRIPAEELYNALSPEKRDELYRMELKCHVKTDAMMLMDDIIFSPDESVAIKVSELYANGKYDCNLSYWENLENLIEKVSKEKESRI